jgi:hypothetical protein
LRRKLIWRFAEVGGRPVQPHNCRTSLTWASNAGKPDIGRKGMWDNIKWAAGQELLEYICQEANKDVEHLVGK